jgi:hypothetical protein
MYCCEACQEDNSCGAFIYNLENKDCVIWGINIFDEEEICAPDQPFAYYVTDTYCHETWGNGNCGYSYHLEDSTGGA